MAKKINKELLIEQYNISCLWITMLGFIFLSFVKELINGHYLIHLYVDSIVGIFAFYVVLHHLRKQYSISDDKKPFIVQVVTLFVGLFIAVISAKSPIDITFLILVIGMITNKKMFIQSLK